ncbi:putative colanic acid biosysnthesis UDP-glucose lipid carrier transferase [Desulfarculales bacterium]
MFQQRLQFFRSILYLGDLCLVVACWVAAYYIRFYYLLFPVTKGVPDFQLYLALLLMVLVIYAVVFQTLGLYRRPWAGLSQTWWSVFKAATTGVVVAVTLAFFVRPYDFSRLVFAHFYVILLVALLAFRPLLRLVWSRTHPEHLGEAVLIVGVDDLGRQLASKIHQSPVLGLRIVGFLTRRPELVGQEIEGAPVLGLYNQVQKVLGQYGIQVLIIALPIAAYAHIHEVVDFVADEMVDIKIVPDLHRFISLHGSVEEFEGLPIIGLRGSPLEGWNSVLKRVVDILGSLVGIVLLGPVMLLIALLVKLCSGPGPVLFRQERMGLDGRVFEMLKFRTMRQNAECETGPVWCQEDDQRRTGLGAFLRATSLDELPQFFNAFKGEMSLVGPRPERPEFIADFRRKVPGYMLRYKVKAGITGWAQINGWRGNTSLEERIKHDLHYIENWSLSFDIKIMALTVVKGFIHPNAY